MALGEKDAAEIRRISDKSSFRKIARGMRKDLDRETLSRIIAAYLVLKASGHSDKEFVNYLAMRETKEMLKLGFAATKSALPMFLVDSEFRSLVINTRREMKKHKELQEEEQRTDQQKTAKRTGKNAAKLGPVTVTIERSSSG